MAVAAGTDSNAQKGRSARAEEPDLSSARRRAFLIVPGFLYILIFFLIPLGALVGTSFEAKDGSFSFEHYAKLWEEPAYAKLLIKTLSVSLTVTLLSLILGYPIGYAIARSNGWVKALLLIALLMPFWTNLLVRAYGWIVILHSNGLVNSSLMRAGLIHSPLPLLFNRTGVLIGMTQIMLPYMALPLAAIMERMDYSLIQAARSLGASSLRSFVHVFVPLTLPGIIAGSILVFVLTLGFFVIPALLGGLGDILIAQMIHYNLTTSLNWGLAAALSAVLLTSTLGVYLIAQRWFRLDSLWRGR